MDRSYATSNQDYIDAPFLSNHDTTRISAQCVDDLEADEIRRIFADDEEIRLCIMGRNWNE